MTENVPTARFDATPEPADAVTDDLSASTLALDEAVDPLIASGTGEGSAAPAPGGAPVPSPRPRTRWAGIVWGLVLAAVAAAGIWLASGDGRLGDLTAWARDLSPAAAVGYGVLAIGGLLLVAGLVGLLRRAQRRLAARSQ